MKNSFTVGVLADNNFSVLPRVTNLFSKRGFSIQSINANLTENSDVSDITIVALGDLQTKEQIIKQLNKLIDVKEVRMIS